MIKEIYHGKMFPSSNIPNHPNPEYDKLSAEFEKTLTSEQLETYLNKSVSVYYRDAVAEECRKLIESVTKPDEAVKYIVALGKRKVLFDLLLDRIEKHVRREK